jgi:hypothetical protein
MAAMYVFSAVAPVDAAIDQIKRRQYPDKVAQYSDNLLLVGINYDRDTKQHTCRIEKG